MTIAPWRVGEPGELDRVGRLDEPGLREVRWMDAEDDRRPAVRQRRLEVGARASGWSCRPRSAGRRSAGRSPGSGRRRRSRRARRARPRPRACPASPTAERDRRRVVDRDERVLAAGQRDEMRPRRPGTAARAGRPRGRIRAASTTRAARVAASIAAAGHGARPRLVCRTTPVALRTEVRPLPASGRRRQSSRARTAGASASSPLGSRLPRSQPRPLVVDHVARDRRDRLRVGAGARAAAERREQPLDARGSRAIGRHRVLRGGNAWESNPPRRAERRATGFEDQGTHRDPTAPIAMVARGPRVRCGRGVIVDRVPEGDPAGPVSSEHDRDPTEALPPMRRPVLKPQKQKQRP